MPTVEAFIANQASSVNGGYKNALSNYLETLVDDDAAADLLAEVADVQEDLYTNFFSASDNILVTEDVLNTEQVTQFIEDLNNNLTALKESDQSLYNNILPYVQNVLNIVNGNIDLGAKRERFDRTQEEMRKTAIKFRGCD